MKIVYLIHLSKQKAPKGILFLIFNICCNFCNHFLNRLLWFFPALRDCSKKNQLMTIKTQAFPQVQEIQYWSLQSVSANTWWQQTVSLFPQAAQQGSQDKNRYQAVMTFSASETMSAADSCSLSSELRESPVYNSHTVFCGVLFWIFAVCIEFNKAGIWWWGDRPASNHADSVCKHQKPSFWLIFHKLTPAAMQSQCKDLPCFWLIVIYHTLACLVHSDTMMKNRPQCAGHFIESGIKYTLWQQNTVTDFILCPVCPKVQSIYWFFSTHII